MVTGAINALMLGIGMAGGTVIGTRYMGRFLDRMERRRRCEEKKE